MQRTRAESRRTADAARRPATADEHPLLELQRQLGNQAVHRMLVARKEAPPATRLGETPVTKLDGTTDATTWAQQVRARAFLPLYAEIAALVQADRVEDVKATGGRVNPPRRGPLDEPKTGPHLLR